MPVDTNIFSRLRSKEDFDREEQLFQLRKLQAQGSKRKRRWR